MAKISNRGIHQIISRITLGDMFGKDPHWRIMEKGDGFLIQLTFLAPDLGDDRDGTDYEVQSCRKWWVSSHCTLSEVVETAFKAARAAIDHELKESFRFEGEPVYNPHFDVMARKELCYEERYDIRE